MRFYFFFLLNFLFHFSFSQNYNVNTIPKEVRQNADAVVRLDKMDVIIESRDQMEVNSKRVVTVFNEDGNEHVLAYTYYDKMIKYPILKLLFIMRREKKSKK